MELDAEWHRLVDDYTEIAYKTIDEIIDTFNENSKILANMLGSEYPGFSLWASDDDDKRQSAEVIIDKRGYKRILIPANLIAKKTAIQASVDYKSIYDIARLKIKHILSSSINEHILSTNDIEFCPRAVIEFLLQKPLIFSWIDKKDYLSIAVLMDSFIRNGCRDAKSKAHDLTNIIKLLKYMFGNINLNDLDCVIC